MMGTQAIIKKMESEKYTRTYNESEEIQQNQSQKTTLTVLIGWQKVSLESYYT